MEKLFEKRTGIAAGEFPKLVKCSWPIGKITFYKDCLVVDAMVEKYTLKYSDIEYITANFLQINIIHRNPSVIKDISLNQPFLASAVKKGIQRYNIPIIIQ